jgi:eukaryotic-like serine/threonine-protein kinase
MTGPAGGSFGPYLIQDVIAACDVTEVSLATMINADGTTPLIVLRRVQESYAERERLNRELLEHGARYAVLHHPNIVEVKDLGTLQGRSYVATELVRGRSLLSALATCGRLGLGFPTDVALHITGSALDALTYAHNLKAKDGASLAIYHRDLRHSNVLLSFEGIVKIADFELAVGSTHNRTPLGVCVGGRQGFFSYLSPEEARGEPIDARADLFSLGIVLYELVTGRHLFSDADEDALLDRLRSGVFELPIARYRPDLNPELESIIRTALAPEANDRFSSSEAFKDALMSFLGSVNVAPGPQNVRDLMEKLFGPEERGPDAREDE